MARSSWPPTVQAETGRLFEAYARLLRVLPPRAFVFENVKGLLSAADNADAPGGARITIKQTLQAAGYRLAWKVVDAADYGTPQHRERVIVVGLRGLRGTPFGFQEPTHGDPSSLEVRPDRPRSYRAP